MTLKSPHIGRRTAEPSRLSGATTGLNAHRMVAEVAVSMAEEYFETFAADNAFYRGIRAQGQITEKAARLVFVERVAPRLLEDARRALTDCLTLGDDVMPRKQKDEIAAALILDTDLRANRFVAEENATIPSVLH
jgi:hypothetical protein